MPSVKRKLKELERDNAKVAKTNTSIASFFGVDTSAETQSPETTPGTECVEVESPVKTTTGQHEPVGAVPRTPEISKHRLNSGHRRSFNPKWIIDRPWLVFKSEETADGEIGDAMFCSLCQKWDTVGSNGTKVWTTVGCVSTRLDIVIGHERSPMHKESVASELTSEAGIQANVEKMNAGLLDAQKLLYFLIKHNLPHTTLFKPLMELCVDLGATNLPYLSQGKNATYTSHRIVEEYLDCQAEVVKETVEEKMKSSDGYGLMLDEYTDNSARKHLALVGKYLDNGCSKLAFLKDIQIPNGTADTIYTSTKDFLEKDTSITLKKMTSFASDGPSVMVGKKNGVVAKLKQDNPAVITTHCMNHRLQFAVAKAFNSVAAIKKTDEVLSAVFKYYHYSTVRTESLNAIQTTMREMGELESATNLTMKRAVHTRWLSHEKAVQTVRKLYIPICHDLQNAVADGRDKKMKDGTGIPASSLLKIMRNYQSVYFIHLLCDVCAVLASLTRLFEREEVDLSIIEPKVQATITNISRMKTKPGPYTAKVTDTVKEMNVTVDMESVTKARDQFIDNLTEMMEERMENSDLINKLSTLNLTQMSPDNATFYGDTEVTELADHFNMDSDQTLLEWNELKEVFKDEADRCTPRHILQTLTQKKPTLGSCYQNIVKLLGVAETLIISTAPVERVFSKVSLIVTDHRNRLLVPTTNKLLMVSLNTESVKDIDLDKVVHRFIEMRKRRIL